MAESHYSIIMRTLHLVVVCCGKKAFKKGHLFAQLLTLCKITLVSKRFGINQDWQITIECYDLYTLGLTGWPQLESLDLIIAHSNFSSLDEKVEEGPEIFQILEFGLPRKRAGVKTNPIYNHVLLKPWQNNKSRKVSWDAPKNTWFFVASSWFKFNKRQMFYPSYFTWAIRYLWN